MQKRKYFDNKLIKNRILHILQRFKSFLLGFSTKLHAGWLFTSAFCDVFGVLVRVNRRLIATVMSTLWVKKHAALVLGRLKTSGNVINFQNFFTVELNNKSAARPLGRNVAAAKPDESSWRWWTDWSSIIFDVWRGLEQSVISDATNEWRRRLRVCIRTKEGYLSISVRRLLLVCVSWAITGQPRSISVDSRSHIS